MTPELQKYYEARFDLMSKEGWKDLMEDIDTMIESLNNISTIPDEKSLQFKKGELDRKSTRLNSSHLGRSRMPSSA